MDCYTHVEKEDCNTDVENEIVARIMRMNLEETTPAPVVRRNSMVGHWVELAKQEEDTSVSQWVEQAKPEEDPLGLEGLRRISPNGGLDEEVEATTFIWSGLEVGAEEQRSTLSLPQLQLQPPASFQPSSSRSAGALLLQPINGILTHQTQQNSLQQHNQGLATSHNQGLAASHNQGLAASRSPNVGFSRNEGGAANDIDIANVYVHPYPAKRNGRGLARARSPAQPPTNLRARSPAQPPTNSRSRSPTQPPTNSRFGDGCTSDLNQDDHPSCHGEENRSESSWYITDLIPGEVNPDTSYVNWSTISNSDSVPPYQTRINSGSASGFQTSTGSASGFQVSTVSALGFQTSTGSALGFQTSTGSALGFQTSIGSALGFQTSTGSALGFQTSTGSASNFQVSTSHGAASSGLGYGFQPFSTVRNEDRTRSHSLGGGMRPTLVGQPGGPRSSGRRHSGPRSGNGRRFCNFCKTNGESSDVYLDHSTGTPGAVTCPNLFKHSCEICGATGRNAHTRGYCPQRKNNSRPVVLELKGTQRKSDGSFR